MQSHKCAAPPTVSRSTSVTSAPSVAATVAAVLPAGPPPRITKRTDTPPGYRTRSARNATGAIASLTLPEMRHDALTDRLVIVAAERAARPETFRRTVVPPPAHPT